MKWMDIWHKLKWKYILLFILSGVMFILFFYNLYIRNVIDEALFQAFIFIICLTSLSPLLIKIFIFLNINRISKQYFKEINSNNEILEMLTRSIAAKHNIQGATAVELIINNIICLLRAFGIKALLDSLDIKDDFNIFYINGKEYSFNKYFSKKKDEYIFSLRIEIELLYRDYMDIKEIIKKTIEIFNNEIKKMEG